MLYRIPKGDISPDKYTSLETFAFEAFDHLFFTDRDTATKFGGSEVVEINHIDADPVEIEDDSPHGDFS